MDRPAEIRYYFDADVLGLGHIVASQRPDCTYAGDLGRSLKRRLVPPCDIAPITKDDVWIPRVAERGWVIITRDRRIQEHRAEIEAVRTNSAKLITLVATDATDTWSQLEILMRQWRRIEHIRDDAGPWIYAASRTSLRQLAL